MTPNLCDFTVVGTLDSGHSLLVCTRGGCGKTVRVRGTHCRAVCRVQPEGVAIESHGLGGVVFDVTECAGCEAEARKRRERDATPTRVAPADYPGAATDDV